jgi:hypothetical protein
MRRDILPKLQRVCLVGHGSNGIQHRETRTHCRSWQRGAGFAAFLQRSPETATDEDVRRFQLHLAETGTSIPNRNRLMTGLRFLLRVTLRRLDLAAEIYHLREPQKIPQVISRDEARRLLAVANSLRTRLLVVTEQVDQQNNAPMTADEYYQEQAERMWAHSERVAAENRRTWLDPHGTGKSFWNRD